MAALDSAGLGPDGLPKSSGGDGGGVADGDAKKKPVPGSVSSVGGIFSNAGIGADHGHGQGVDGAEKADKDNNAPPGAGTA